MITERLFRLRKEAKLQQKDVAEKLGVARNTYNGYETGKRTPDLGMISKIASLFDVSTDYLIGRTDVPQENTSKPLVSENDFDDLEEMEEVVRKAEAGKLAINGVPISETKAKMLRAILESYKEEIRSQK